MILDPLEQNAAFRLAYEFIVSSMEEGEEPDEATLRDLLRKGTLNMTFVPVLCGSAFKNKGVQPL